MRSCCGCNKFNKINRVEDMENAWQFPYFPIFFHIPDSLSIAPRLTQEILIRDFLNVAVSLGEIVAMGFLVLIKDIPMIY